MLSANLSCEKSLSVCMNKNATAFESITFIRRTLCIQIETNIKTINTETNNWIYSILSLFFAKIIKGIVETHFTRTRNSFHIEVRHFTELYVNSRSPGTFVITSISVVPELSVLKGTFCVPQLCKWKISEPIGLMVFFPSP